MTETPVPRTGPSHRHPESIMPLNRRNFLGAAALGAGSLMLGCLLYTSDAADE